ncbi:hypothetical protein IAP91_15055 [Leuconostoc mesenteroides]|nr:hypothetical protein [Leuconostoc mesenteroides]
MMKKVKQVIITVLFSLIFFRVVNYMTVSASEISTEAEVTFNGPSYIPVEKQSLDNQQQVVFVNGPVASGEYDRKFGDTSLGKGVVSSVPQLPHVGENHIQVGLYILGSLIIILMITIKKRKGNKYHE